MTQFKEKSAKREHLFISAGLFTYPALQAADILLYDADEVPVGDDQRQHVEITRDAAIRFNHRFGDTFVVPEAVTPAAGARVMSLQDPTSKMSKSDESDAGCVYLTDEPAAIMKKFKRAVTDSETGPDAVRFDRASQAGREFPAGDQRRGHRPHAAAGRREPRAVRVVEGRDRRGRRRRTRTDPAALPRTHGGPGRAGPPAPGRVGQGPHRRVGHPRSRPPRHRHAPRLSVPELLAYPRAREVHENGVILMVLLGPTDRRIIALGIPALGTLAVEPLYRLVDTAIVGRIGTDELGGVAIAVTVLTLVVAGSNFLTYGTTERVADRIGAGRPDDAAAVGVQAMWLAVIVGVIAAPVLFAFAPLLTALLGADGAVHDSAVEYLRIASLGIPFVLLALGAQGVQRGRPTTGRRS